MARGTAPLVTGRPGLSMVSTRVIGAVQNGRSVIRHIRREKSTSTSFEILIFIAALHRAGMLMAQHVPRIHQRHMPIHVLTVIAAEFFCACGIAWHLRAARPSCGRAVEDSLRRLLLCDMFRKSERVQEMSLSTSGFARGHHLSISILDHDSSTGFLRLDPQEQSNVQTSTAGIKSIPFAPARLSPS